jgi:hypothetical protein
MKKTAEISELRSSPKRTECPHTFLSSVVYEYRTQGFKSGLCGSYNPRFMIRSPNAYVAHAWNRSQFVPWHYLAFNARTKYLHRLLVRKE